MVSLIRHLKKISTGSRGENNCIYPLTFARNGSIMGAIIK